MKDDEDCADDRDESEGSLFDQVEVCPVGDRQDCGYYRHGKPDFCQHQDLGSDEDACPLDVEEEQGIDPDDPGNQDKED